MNNKYQNVPNYPKLADQAYLIKRYILTISRFWLFSGTLLPLMDYKAQQSFSTEAMTCPFQCGPFETLNRASKAAFPHMYITGELAQIMSQRPQ